jgi:hypothetical protein
VLHQNCLRFPNSVSMFSRCHCLHPHPYATASQLQALLSSAAASAVNQCLRGRGVRSAVTDMLSPGPGVGLRSKLASYTSFTTYVSLPAVMRTEHAHCAPVAIDDGYGCG